MHIYDHFQRVIQAAPEPVTVVEVGACDGVDTLRMYERLLATGKKFSLTAIEPLFRNYEIMSRRMCTAGNKVHLLNAAVGQVNGVVDFWDSVTPEYYGSSSIREPKDSLTLWPTMKFEKKTVECLTLDSLFCPYPDRIDFIWADVQGAEIDLILGGKEALKKTRYFYTEFSDKELYAGEIKLPEILELLPDFEIVEQYDHDVLLKNVNV